MKAEQAGDSPSPPFTLQAGKEKEEQFAHEVHVTAAQGAATLVLDPPNYYPTSKITHWSLGVRKRWCLPICIILPERGEISVVFSPNLALLLAALRSLEMLFIRIHQTLLSVYFMHYLLLSPETNATPVPVIYCI